MSRLMVTTSWDDGGILDLRLSRLLTKYNIKGTFYIPKSHRRVNPLRKEDILEIAEEHEVGAHTLNHVDLTKVSPPEVKIEVEGSKSYLEDILGKKVRMFCYPKGRYNKETKEIVKRAGFIGARTVDYAAPDTIGDPFEWGISLAASDRSPRTTFKIWRKSHISIKSLLDWEIRAKLLFDLALAKGGVWHLWGHSWEIDKAHEWDKLERVINYASNREGVWYSTNAEILDTCRGVDLPHKA